MDISEVQVSALGLGEEIGEAFSRIQRYMLDQLFGSPPDWQGSYIPVPISYGVSHGLKELSYAPRPELRGYKYVTYPESPKAAVLMVTPILADCDCGAKHVRDSGHSSWCSAI